MKTIVFYGNCHIVALENLLMQIPEFNEKYTVLPLKPIQEITNIKSVCEDVISKCDVFVHQSIQLENKYGMEYSSAQVMGYLKPDVTVIAIPNLYGLPKFLFPMYSTYETFNSAIKRRGAFFYRDLIIDELYSRGKTAKQISAEYENACLAKCKSVSEEAEEDFFQKVRMREAEWSFNVEAFLRENYKSELLFYDPNHPTEKLIEYYAKQVLKLLDINETSKNIEEYKGLALNRFSVPLTKAVIETYGLHFAQSEIRPMGIKLRPRKMDIQEYVLQYCAFEWQNKDLPFRYRAKSFFSYCPMALVGVSAYLLKRLS